VILLDERLDVIKANPAFLRDFHVDKEDTLGASIFALGNGQWDIAELRHLLGDVIPKAQAVLGFEVDHDFPSIGRRTFLVSARRLVQPENASINLFITFVDVTEERKNAQEVDLLLAETQHRVKNALAVVHSIAYQTPTEGRSAEEYRDAYLGRLDAFLSTENLIGRAGEAGVTLPQLIDDALQAVNARQIMIQRGASFRLARAQVRPLRMIFHELTTNAFKYGALSRPEGVVHLKWAESGNDGSMRVELDWREEGGPPVTAPARMGFGVSMIERTAKVNGWRADVRYEPKGLVVQIVFPLPQVAPSGGGGGVILPGPGREAPPASGILRPRER
jgi:two-component sensor histidine kinase